MKTQKVGFYSSLLVVLSFVLSACGSAFAEPTLTSTPVPTNTIQPTATITPTITNTPWSSPTPHPTRTPNLAVTQQFEEYQTEVDKYFELGYLKTRDGKFIQYDDFKEEWAQLRWYRRWTYDNTADDLLISAHFKWSSAFRNADVSGCGFVFGIQENGDHFAVFLDRTVIRFLSNYQSSTSRMKVTRGTDRVNFGNPADEPVEADFTIIVKDAYVYVLVNEEVVGEYTLSQSRVLRGKVGLTLLSGTNKDYGTRCEMTNIHMFTPDN